MSSYKKRIDALERNAPQQDEEPFLIITSFVAVGGHSRLGLAHIVGLGRFEPEEGESDDEFLRRVYAMRIANKHMEDMTSEEREAALAKADERIALENAEKTCSVAESGHLPG